MFNHDIEILTETYANGIAENISAAFDSQDLRLKFTPSLLRDINTKLHQLIADKTFCRAAADYRQTKRGQMSSWN